ncbi:Rho GTPase activation protein [Globomyces pollinis-pini]|nr:Rho GTPase activation protein [Globomyces pollinis-pini]
MGIYRVSGSTKDIGEIKLAFDTYYDVDLLQMMPDTNAVASLFKQYVRELPECLLTFQLEPQFIALFAHYTDSDLQFPESLKPTDPHPVIQDQNLIMGLKQLIEKLPTCNRDFLGMFMHHLSKISRNSNVNKMTRSNLLLVWSPTLRFGGACLTVMVILCELLFPISHISEPVKTKLNTKRSAPSVKVNNIKTGSSKPVPISASDTQRAAAQLSKSEPELSSPTVQYPGGRRPSKHNLVMIPARQSSKEKQVSTSWNEMIDYDDQETSKPRKTGTADLVDFFNESRIEKPIKAISSSNIDQKSVNSSSKSPLNSGIHNILIVRHYC